MKFKWLHQRRAECRYELYKTLFHGKVLVYDEKRYEVGEGKQDPSILAAAIRLVPERETVFLSVVDAKGCWPGDRSEYQAYLAHALAEIKYVTGEAPSHGPADCPLCGKTSTTLFPNALKGVGINFSNMDRAGAFPGLDTGQAWKGYGLCLDCADLLYIFLYRDGSFRFKTLVNGYNLTPKFCAKIGPWTKC